MSQIVVFLLLSLPLVGAYAIFSLGLVVIYRASKVLNLAHGAMAMIPAYLVATMSDNSVPIIVAFPFGIAAGAALGLGIEFIFVRPLRNVSPTAQTVGTVAALGLLVATAGKIWGTGGRAAPGVFPSGQISIANSGIKYGEIGLFAVMLLVAGGLYLLLQRTPVGLAMRGAADNPRAAGLMGVNPQLATAGAWAIGGGTAAIAGILLAAVTTLHPVVLSLQAVPALVAALIGGMGSLPGALAGAAAVGGTLGLVPAVPALQRIEGSAQLLLTILAMGVMAARGERYVATNVRGAVGGAAKETRRPGAVMSRQAMAVLAGVIVVFPWLPFVSFSVLGSVNLAAYYALVAISLVVLVGWVGQISLGHAGIVGVGAYVTGYLIQHWHMTFPVNLIWAGLAGGAVAIVLGAVAVRVRGLYLAVATLIFSWMAVEFLFRQSWLTENASSNLTIRAFGEPGTFPYFDWTARRTYFYAAWAVVAAAIFLVSNLRDARIGRAFFAVRGSEVAAASLGISVVRTKLLAFAISGALAGVAGNLLLVRDQVVTPDAFRVEVSLFFLAVAVVGGLSSLGGALASALVFAALNEMFYRLEFLSGWLEVVPPLLLTIVLLLYRSGLAGIPDAVDRRFGSQLRAVVDRLRPVLASAGRIGAAQLQRIRRPRDSAAGDRSAAAQPRLSRLARLIENERIPARARDLVARALKLVRTGRRPVAVEPRLDLEGVVRKTRGEIRTPVPLDNELTLHVQDLQVRDWRHMQVGEVELQPDRASRRPLIVVDGVTVQFGGLTAVGNLSMSVRENEIVGLIGPNGAGKTTTFNAIAGLNVPAAGRVEIFGHDVTSWTVDQRARLGVGRTFQAIQLLPQLTVFENLLVATHTQNEASILSQFFVGPATLDAERRCRRQVRLVAELLDLEEHLDRIVADLPFGILRMVELARALVTGSRLIMLDEPASGLDSTETERLTELVRFVRGLGVTILLIEHDVKMVTSVSDYMYVLDYGQLLSEGVPADVQRDPRVIAAYLGESPEDAGVSPSETEALV